MTASIGLIMTGGTIESIGADRLDLAWYIENGKRLEGQELLARVPEVGKLAAVKHIPFRRLPSHALTSVDWLELGRLIEDSLEDDALDGIVVAHGTNMLEETAYFLHLTLNTRKPVVLTGAMRPSSAISADGYLNLVNAVRVASDPRAADRGCLVVLNDTIFSARDVTKTSTYRVESFQSRDLGPLGVADADGKVVFYHRSDRLHTRATSFRLASIESLPRVDVTVSYVGADSALIDAATAAGARGIVSAASGSGRPTPAEDAAFDRALRDYGVLMCLSSRIAGGRSVRSPGLAQRGFVAGDNLPPWKARLLLALSLTQTRDAETIQAIFDTH